MMSSTLPAPGSDTTRTRVVFVIDNMSVGGTELNAVRTAERLDRERFDLRVVSFSFEGPILERYRALGIPVVSMPLTSLYGRSMIDCGRRFVRYLRDERVRVVHAHDMYSNVFAVPWARLAGTRAIIASRRWWHTLPNRKLRIGNTAAFHLAHAVLANSPEVARSVRERDGVAANRVWTISNFVDDRAFAPLAEGDRAAMRTAWRVPDGALVVGAVARLVPVKDHATMLRAFAEVRTNHRTAHLVLIGDGPSRADLERLSGELGVAEAVSFVGELPQGENYHRAFDISALSSLSEGFPNTIIEAMAAGTPVVATAVGGSLDAISSGISGVLVPPASPGDFAHAFRMLLDSPETRKKMGAAGRERARGAYAAAPAVEALEGMYDTLCR
jgi:glycosyltransferase involved in cell wall biosynthesis